MGARPLFNLRDVEIYLDVPSSSLALGPIVVNAEGHVQLGEGFLMSLEQAESLIQALSGAVKNARVFLELEGKLPSVPESAN